MGEHMCVYVGDEGKAHRDDIGRTLEGCVPVGQLGWVGNIPGQGSTVGGRSLIAGFTEQQEANVSEHLVIRIKELRPGKHQDTDHSGLRRPL